MPIDAAVLLTLASEIAAKLGDGWTPGSHSGARFDTWSELQRGTGSDAPTIRISVPSWRNQNRLHISGIYPAGRERPYHLTMPEITVADTKPAERIAGDIRRRLLPGYLEDLTRVIAYDQEQQRFHEARLAATERLAAVLPGNTRVSAERHTTNGEMSWWGDRKSPAGRVHRVHVKVDYEGREVLELELSSVSLEVAEQILRLVAP